MIALISIILLSAICLWLTYRASRWRAQCDRLYNLAVSHEIQLWEMGKWARGGYAGTYEYNKLVSKKEDLELPQLAGTFKYCRFGMDDGDFPAYHDGMKASVTRTEWWRFWS